MALVATSHVADNLTAVNEDNTGIPWLTSITETQKQIFVYVNIVFLSEAVGIFGIIANVINAIVFYRQGLKTTINISFFAIAISDLISLFILQWYIAIPLLKFAGLPMVYSDVQYISGCVPHETFTRITCSITMYVTAERCLCVVFPLYIKQIITPKLTAAIIVFLYFTTLICPIPLFCTSYLGWNFYLDRNATLLGLVFTDHKAIMEKVVYLVHSIVTLLSALLVVIFTLILVVKLQQKSTWRQTMNSQKKQQESISNKERKTMTMVVLIATILVVCYTPSIVLSSIAFFDQDFNPGGKYEKLHYILWSFAILLNSINSSVNIFLYLKMSTKYKLVFYTLFRMSLE